jgi:hypothetical protein
MTLFVHEQSLRGAGDNSSMRAVQLYLAHAKEGKDSRRTEGTLGEGSGCEEESCLVYTEII